MCGTVCLDSVRRRAIVLRTLLSLVASWGMSGTAAGFAAGTDAAGALAPAAGAASLAPSTSARTMRPFGPVPLSVERSILFSAAIRRASGLAFTRSPDDFAGVAAAGAGVASAGVALGASAATAALGASA